MLTKQEKNRLKKTAMAKIIAHWASNEDLAKGPKIFESGKGCYLRDIDGNEYLDTFSSLITAASAFSYRSWAASPITSTGL